jgi:hypothetical protein
MRRRWRQLNWDPSVREEGIVITRGLNTAVIFAGLAVAMAGPAWAADVRVSAIAFSLERNVTGVAVLVAGPNLASAIQNAYGQAVATCRANGGGPDCGPAGYAVEGDCSVLLYDPAPRLARPRGVYQGGAGKTIEAAMSQARQGVPDINPALPPREQVCA